MIERLRRIQAQRIKLAHLRMLIEEERKRWQETIREWTEAASEAAERVMEMEAELRAEAAERYAQDGDKHPVPGVNIRVVRECDYDLIEARKWALTHFPPAMQLNRQVFEKFAMTFPASVAGVVEVREAAQVTIASDLSQAVGTEMQEEAA